jgi:hypothetical protein
MEDTIFSFDVNYDGVDTGVDKLAFTEFPVKTTLNTLPDAHTITGGYVDTFATHRNVENVIAEKLNDTIKQYANRKKPTDIRTRIDRVLASVHQSVSDADVLKAVDAEDPASYADGFIAGALFAFKNIDLEKTKQEAYERGRSDSLNDMELE